MDQGSILLLAALFFVVATMYSSVGHAGASGYIAAMSLIGMVAADIRPTALALNLVVGGIGLIRFARAGHVPIRPVLPLVLASAPMAWVGARLKLPDGAHEIALAAVLVLSAGALLVSAARAAEDDLTTQPKVPWPAGLAAGAGIGLLSGITGTGGAIFLTPLLLFLHWAPTRSAAGMSVAFVWINSLLGLAGLLSVGASVPSAFPIWVVAVIAGAFLGTQLGLRILPIPVLRRVLALVLIVAAGKLVFA